MKCVALSFSCPRPWTLELPAVISSGDIGGIRLPLLVMPDARQVFRLPSTLCYNTFHKPPRNQLIVLYQQSVPTSIKQLLGRKPSALYILWLANVNVAFQENPKGKNTVRSLQHITTPCGKDVKKFRSKANCRPQPPCSAAYYIACLPAQNEEFTNAQKMQKES